MQFHASSGKQRDFLRPFQMSCIQVEVQLKVRLESTHLLEDPSSQDCFESRYVISKQIRPYTTLSGLVHPSEVKPGLKRTKLYLGSLEIIMISCYRVADYSSMFTRGKGVAGRRWEFRKGFLRSNNLLPVQCNSQISALGGSSTLIDTNLTGLYTRMSLAGENVCSCAACAMFLKNVSLLHLLYRSLMLEEWVLEIYCIWFKV